MRLTRWSMGALLVGACGVTVASAPTSASAAAFKVFPGDSIQAAVDAAASGDKIIVYPGVYQEDHGGAHGVHVTKSLKMIGKKKGTERVVVRPAGAQQDGIRVEPANPGDPDIDGFSIKGFVFEDFPKNGIHLRHCQNFKIDKNESARNLENGIFPVLSANGRVSKNVSYGAEDSALWVEASENVRVLKNELYESPTGLEITVSNNVEAKGNDVHTNSTGVGLYHPNGAAEDPLATMLNWEIVKNHVHENNFPNPAPPGSLSADLPVGGGILVLGVDGVTVAKNTIENNDFYGVAVVDWCLATEGTPTCSVPLPPGVNSQPESNTVESNTFTNNGTNAPPDHPLKGIAADITYLVLGGTWGNCFAKNDCGGQDCSTANGTVKIGGAAEGDLFLAKCP